MEGGISSRKEKAALPVLLEARPHSVKATGQFWKGQDQNCMVMAGAWQR